MKLVNLLSLWKEMAIQIQWTIRTPNRHDQKRISSHHIIVKMQECRTKESLWESVREKCQVTYKSKYQNISKPTCRNPKV
jgi:hypothetical protein